MCLINCVTGLKQHWVWTLASVKVQKSDLKKANVYKAE